MEKGFSIVCLVGDDILNQCGTTGRMLAALGRHSVSIRATAQGSSERNISVIVHSEDVNRAIRYIHDEFFGRTAVKDVNLFVAGYGTMDAVRIGLPEKRVILQEEFILFSPNSFIFIVFIYYSTVSNKKQVLDWKRYNPESVK